MVNRRTSNASIAQHEDFPNKLLHVSIKCAKLETPGSSEQFFSALAQQPPPPPPPMPMVVEDEEEERLEALPTGRRVRLMDDDLHRIVNEGFEVDYDNIPTAKNNRSLNNNDADGIAWSDWGFQGLDLRHESSQQVNENPQIP